MFSGQDEWKFKAQNEDQNMPGFQRGHADFAREPMDTQNNYREVTSGQDAVGNEIPERDLKTKWIKADWPT